MSVHRFRKSVAGVVALSAFFTCALNAEPSSASSPPDPVRLELGASQSMIQTGIRGAQAQRAALSSMVNEEGGVDAGGGTLPEPVDEVVGDVDAGVTSDFPPMDRNEPAPVQPVDAYDGPPGYIDGESVIVDGSPNSLTFRNPDGSNTTHFYSADVVFQDEGGQWKLFDNTPVATPDGRVEPAASELEVSFAEDASSSELTAIAQPDGSSRVTFSLVGAADTEAVLIPGGVRYESVFPFVDLEERSFAGGVKEDLVLHQLPTSAPAYSFSVDAPGLEATQTAEGDIEFRDSLGELIWMVPSGTAWDADESVIEELRRVGVDTTLAGSDGSYTITLAPDWDWLSDPARVFPIVIDPTFDTKTGTTAANKRDGYVVATVPNGSYNGTSGTYSQWSSLANTYVNKVGFTMPAANTWHEYQSYFYAKVAVPASPARQIVGAYFKAMPVLMWEYDGTTGAQRTPITGMADFEIAQVNETWTIPASGGTYQNAATDLYWNNRPTVDPASASQQVVATGQWLSVDILPWVLSWDANPSSNYGLRLRGLGNATYDSGHGFFQLGSLESSSSTPYIEVTYFRFPTLSAPADNWGVSTAVHKKDTDLVTFSWTDSDAVANSDLNYRVRVCTDTAFTQNCVDGDSWVGSTATSQAIPAYRLSQNVDLYWRVEKKRASIGAADAEVVSTYRKFKLTNAQPPAPASATPTSTASLTVAAVTDPNAGDPVYYNFEVCDQPFTQPGDCISSGWQSSTTFTAPQSWASTYYWRVMSWDGLPTSTVGYSELETVPQSANNSSVAWVLGNYPHGAPSGVVDASSGNVYFTETDQTIATLGADFSVKRSYNSLDDRNSLFGRGWTYALDMSVTTDAAGNASVVMPDGRVEYHGKNPNGTFAAAFGYSNKLTKTSSPNQFKLVDSARTEYRFQPKSGSTNTWELISIKTADGRNTTVSWTTSPSVTATITDVVTSRSLTFTLTTPAGATRTHVTKVETQALAALGGAKATWTYAYVGDNLVSSCSPNVLRDDGSTGPLCTTYTYNATNDLTAKVLPQLKVGSATTKKTSFAVTYDAFGRADTQTSGAGGIWTYQYFDNVSIPMPSGTATARYRVWVTEPTGGIRAYAFDTARRLIYERDQGDGASPAVYGQTWIQYNSFGFMVKTTKRVGPVGASPEFATTNYVVNQRGQTVSRTESNGAVWSYTYRASGLIATETSPLGMTTTYWYNSDDQGNAGMGSQLLTKTQQSPGVGQSSAVLTHVYSNSTTAAYQGLTADRAPRNLLVRITGPTGAVTTMEYDKKGDLRTRTEPSGLKTEYTYDELGRETKQRLYYGGAWHVISEKTYDAMGRQTSVLGEPVANVISGVVHRLRTQTAYDDSGNIKAVTLSDAGGSASPDQSRTTTYKFDNANRKSEVIDALGFSTRYEYDLAGRPTATIDADGTRIAYAFDPRGLQITQYLDESIDTVLERRTYSADQKVVTTTDELGRVRRITYDQFGMGWPTRTDIYENATAVAAGQIFQVQNTTTYDAVGQPIVNTSFGTVSGSGQVLQTQRIETAYDLWGRQATVTTYDGSITTIKSFTYDATGNVVTERTTGGQGAGLVSRETRATFDGSGQQLTATMENGATDLISRFQYDNRNLRTTTFDARAAGSTASQFRADTAYDVLGRVTAVTQPSVTSVVIDRNTGTATSSNASPVANVGYNTFGEITHETTPTGALTTQVRDGLGRVTQTIHPTYSPPTGNPVTPTESSTFTPEGNLATRTDRLGKTTTFTYDALNRVTRMTYPAVGANPAGFSTTEYDLVGNVTATVDQTGSRREWTYDALDRATSETSVVRRAGLPSLRLTTTLTLDAAGRVIESCAPPVDGVPSCSTSAYSPVGRVLWTKTPLGHQSTFEYDVLGRLTKSTDPLGRATTTTYDAAGRVASTSIVDSTNAVLTTTSYTYDEVGKVLTSQTSGGALITFTYDAIQRLKSVTERLTPTSNVVVSYDYDIGSRLTRIIDGRGNTWGYTYNPWGLVQDHIEPSTAAHPAIVDRRYTTVYNAAGLATQTTEPGGVVINRVYDELGRITSEGSLVATNAPSASRTWQYDLAGRPLAFGSPAGATVVTYDDRGLPVSTSWQGAVTASFVYDDAGRVTARADQTGTSSFGWDKDNRLVAETDPLTNQQRSYAWNSAGQVTGVVYSVGGMSRTYGYDAYGRPSSDVLVNGAAQVQRGVTYTYDSSSRVVAESVVGVAAGTGTNGYGYDLAGRLVSWQRPDGSSQTFGWDAAGNRTGFGTTVVTYDERNRLVSSNAGLSQSWTPRSTLLSSTAAGVTTNHTFDGLGRMTVAGSVSFTYDGLSRVASRTAASVTTPFGYSGLNQQPTSDGSNLISRSPGGDPISLKVGGGNAVSVGQDRHGDVVALFDPSGSGLSDSVDYSPFGVVSSRVGSTQMNIGFQGHWTDPGTGLVNMGARWYSPGSGRFLSRDVIRPKLEQPVSLNMYTYANNDPVGLFDPDGREPRSWVGTRDERARSRLSSFVYYGSQFGPRPVARRTPPPRNAVVQAERGELTRAERDQAQFDWVQNRIAENKKRDRDYDPAQDAELMRVAHAVVGENLSVYDTANEGHSPDENISKDDFEAVADNKNGQYSALLQWAAQQLLSNDDHVSEKQRESVMSGETDPGEVGWGLWGWKSKKGFFSKALDVVTSIAKVGLGFLPYADCFTAAFDLVSGNGVDTMTAVGCAADLIGGPIGGKAADAFRGVSNANDASKAVDAARYADSASDSALTANRATDASRIDEGVTNTTKTSAPACSFSGDTDVLMADGTRKRIDDVEVGDMVVATDPTTGDTRAREVVATLPHTDQLLTLNTSAGDIVTTEDHRYWSVTDSQWQAAQDLDQGDQLLTATDTIVLVEGLDWSTRHTTTAYDLDVQGIDTFYVGTTHTEVLVHNCEIATNFDGTPGGSPALRDNPWSPENVSRRQSQTRRELGMDNIDPDTPIPVQSPGQNIKGTHSAPERVPHDGQRNVGAIEEHSRVAKGTGGRGPRG